MPNLNGTVLESQLVAVTSIRKYLSVFRQRSRPVGCEQSIARICTTITSTNIAVPSARRLVPTHGVGTRSLSNTDRAPSITSEMVSFTLRAVLPLMEPMNNALKYIYIGRSFIKVFDSFECRSVRTRARDLLTNLLQVISSRLLYLFNEHGGPVDL